MFNLWKNLKNPIVGLSPMDGITDHPTRQIHCLIKKPDIMYTEFISAEGFCKNPKAFTLKLFSKENEKPLIVQLFGQDPSSFYEAIIGILENYNFDGIDINMGCPAKNIIKKGGGGELIGNYNLSEKIILKSFEAIKKSKKQIPLSVKTRIGKEKPITSEWIKFLSNNPVSEITIHGRLLKQGISGPVNWEEIYKGSVIAKEKNIKVLGNGGIKSIKQAFEKIQKYNLDGILIGQASIGNPWIFKENCIPTTKEILDTLILHCKYIENFYSPDKFYIAHKFLSWYPKNFPLASKLRSSLIQSNSSQEVILKIERFFKLNKVQLKN